MELTGLSLTELKTWLAERGESPFRANQIFDWVYAKQASSYEEMTNLSKPLRNLLKQELRFPLLQRLRTQESDEGETVKYLWALPDGQRIESVLISSGERRTVCVSCQVGCPARCAFCASGKEGLLRNLSAAEIIEQVLWIQQALQKRGERVCHIVFMGMGEPMENYDAVVRAISLLNDPRAFHISVRRITVSTVGVVEGIRRFAEEERSVNLVLSLHAPNEAIRKKIIPYARRYRLEDVLEAMKFYAKKTKRDITYEYTLIAGINDQIDHAEELSRLLAGQQCTVNLIPYNPIEKIRLQRPEKGVIEAFRDCLVRHGIQTTWRYTKGKDIAAACGQLALQKDPLRSLELATAPQTSPCENALPKEGVLCREAVVSSSLSCCSPRAIEPKSTFVPVM